MKRPYQQAHRRFSQQARHQHHNFMQRANDRHQQFHQEAIRRGQNIHKLQQEEIARFRKARARANLLRLIYPSGKLTDKQLDSLTLRDNQGVYWMAGLDGQSWYRFNGAEWVPGFPASLYGTSRQSDDDSRRIALAVVILIPILLFIAWVLYRLLIGG